MTGPAPLRRRAARISGLCRGAEPPRLVLGRGRALLQPHPACRRVAPPPAIARRAARADRLGRGARTHAGHHRGDRAAPGLERIAHPLRTWRGITIGTSGEMLVCDNPKSRWWSRYCQVSRRCVVSTPREGLNNRRTRAPGQRQGARGRRGTGVSGPRRPVSGGAGRARPGVGRRSPAYAGASTIVPSRSRRPCAARSWVIAASWPSPKWCLPAGAGN